MDDIQQEKEVFFDIYCKHCEYHKNTEEQPPCCECLQYPSNINSHKPVKFKLKETY